MYGDTKTAAENRTMWKGLTRYAQTQNTSRTTQWNHLQGTENED